MIKTKYYFCIMGAIITIMGLIVLTNLPKTNSITSTEFTVKEYNGKIAVFETNNSFPLRIIDIDFSSLPIKDRELLKKGITAPDDEHVSLILQDYDE